MRVVRSVGVVVVLLLVAASCGGSSGNDDGGPGDVVDGGGAEVGAGDADDGGGDDGGGSASAPVALTSAEVCDRLDAAGASAAGVEVTSAAPGNEPGDPTPPSCIYALADNGFVTLAAMRPDEDLLGRGVEDGYEFIVGAAAGVLPESTEPEPLEEVGVEAVWVAGERFSQAIARDDQLVITVSGTSDVDRSQVVALAAAFLGSAGPPPAGSTGGGTEPPEASEASGVTSDDLLVNGIVGLCDDLPDSLLSTLGMDRADVWPFTVNEAIQRFGTRPEVYAEARCDLIVDDDTPALRLEVTVHEDAATAVNRFALFDPGTPEHLSCLRSPDLGPYNDAGRFSGTGVTAAGDEIQIRTVRISAMADRFELELSVVVAADALGERELVEAVAPYGRDLLEELSGVELSDGVPEIPASPESAAEADSARTCPYDPPAGEPLAFAPTDDGPCVDGAAVDDSLGVALDQVEQRILTYATYCLYLEADYDTGYRVQVVRTPAGADGERGLDAFARAVSDRLPERIFSCCGPDTPPEDYMTLVACVPDAWSNAPGNLWIDRGSEQVWLRVNGGAADGPPLEGLACDIAAELS